MNIDETVSLNFNLLKFGSILMVFWGHFFNSMIPMAWAPVTVGLVIFGFSSGYFTSLKYNGNYSIKHFFIQKFKRLAINISIINIFLFCLFMIKKEPHIWTWQTLINLIGLNGFLEWFFIDNISPFGNGMWFLTLLLIFYSIYPLLEKSRPKKLLFSTPIVIIVIFIITFYHSPGHALWLTASAFFIGVVSAKNGIRPSKSPMIPFGICFFCLMLMILANKVFKMGQYNFFFILTFALFFIYGVVTINFGKSVYRVVAIFSASVLEIYLLHTYLFVHISRSEFLNFVLSLCIVLLTAKFLSWISGHLVQKLFSSSRAL